MNRLENDTRHLYTPICPGSSVFFQRIGFRSIDSPTPSLLPKADGPSVATDRFDDWFEWMAPGTPLLESSGELVADSY
ncbi:hypothetical protein BB347_07190 [Natronorubrum daqingense]|uniref:Uncharacterized protein n=1 Tax=Natronorubrum daqingense TaxID=588898 RepID=A0A1P8RCQ2_9EURY|nr:hypothetical protein BB347_07190 [Natronorubrum daqingense]